MIKIIDTHTHLCDDAFDTDRKEVLTRAENAGVVSVLTVSETADDARKNLVLAAEHPVLKPLAGLYPSHLDVDDADSVITFIREHRDHLAGIGEVGLDYWIVKEEMQRDIQREIFTRFIDLSIALDLPLNVHSRSAGQAAIVGVLLRNYENGTPVASGETLLEAAGLTGSSVKSVFDKGRHPAWGTMIVESDRKNNFKIISGPDENQT